MNAKPMQPVAGVNLNEVQWNIVRDILRDLVPQREVWAFGSRTQGAAKPYSDLDIVIVGENPLTLPQHAALNEAFSDSDLPFKVDLVDWATASESFRAIMRRDHVVLQSASTQS